MSEPWVEKEPRKLNAMERTIFEASAADEGGTLVYGDAKFDVSLVESTGVGVFVNVVPGQVKFVLPDGTSFMPSFAAGFPQNLKADGVPYIGAIVCFEAGYVDFIEFYVNGNEPWSGDIDALVVEVWDDVPDDEHDNMRQ